MKCIYEPDMECRYPDSEVCSWCGVFNSEEDKEDKE